MEEKKKIKKEKQIFYEEPKEHPKWKDLKDLVLEDEDLLEIGHDPGYYSENNSWDPHYFIKVIRMVLETDDEYEKRILDSKIFKEESRKRRYENYLKLKKEFENEQ
jgi:hypothetical protein